mmetsp:Transcript_8203/g.20650  ORF Transcript_8203/g.20650 Transcript_8203/m.20650 type:complete len:892 (+) Transcript_8203:70-2745(+)
MEPLAVTLNGQRLVTKPTNVTLEDAPGRFTEAIEAIEESRVCRQVLPKALPGSDPEDSAQSGLTVDNSRTATAATQQTAPQLPGSGCFDQLLQPGCAHELSQHLAEIFRDDPAIDCGRTNGRTAGLSCAYGASYGQKVFSVSAIMQLLLNAKHFWGPLPWQNVVRVSIADDERLIIVGDTHGQLEDVLWMFFKYGLPSASNRYLFNGDIVDRGGHALEIFLVLFAFKRDCPGSVHLLRGNHEDALAICHFGFRAELENKFPDHLSPLWSVFTQLIFPSMPIVALVSDAGQQRQFCVVHGGIPSGSLGLGRPASIENDLARINRFRPTVKNVSSADTDGRILYSFLWADPAGKEDVSESRSKLAGMFVEDETREFCRCNQVSFIVRSHQVPKTLRGVMASHSGLCYTVFSASNYSGCAGNRGGVLLCGGEPLEVRASEHYAPPWPQLARLLPKGDNVGIKAAEEDRLGAARAWEAQFGIKDLDTGLAEDRLSFTFVWDWLRRQFSPKSKTSPMAICNVAARAQMKQFMIERITEHKERLFYSFNCADPRCTGILSKDMWATAMLSSLGPYCQGVISPHVLEDLYLEWRLKEPIQYVQFLHRFQIRDDSSNGSVLVDRIEVVSQLQARLVDFSSLNLEQLLDPDGDKIVTNQEFAEFLPHFHIEIPPWQAAALYETMAGLVRQNPLTLDSTVMCLALASESVPQVESIYHSAVGREILGSGQSFAGVFRSWDTNGDGFLSLPELEQGLRSLAVTHEISHEEAKACMARIESTGILDGQVSVFEFVRAVAPQAMTLALQKSLLMEALKVVWICRPAILDGLARMDPQATNRVTLEEFRKCLLVTSARLKGMGSFGLTDVQVRAICEIAAAGEETVQYADFIRGLHIEDIFAGAG